eukprot:27321_5
MVRQCLIFQIGRMGNYTQWNFPTEAAEISFPQRKEQILFRLSKMQDTRINTACFVWLIYFLMLNPTKQELLVTRRISELEDILLYQSRLVVSIRQLTQVYFQRKFKNFKRRGSDHRSKLHSNHMKEITQLLEDTDLKNLPKLNNLPSDIIANIYIINGFPSKTLENFLLRHHCLNSKTFLFTETTQKYCLLTHLFTSNHFIIEHKENDQFFDKEFFVFFKFFINHKKNFTSFCKRKIYTSKNEMFIFESIQNWLRKIFMVPNQIFLDIFQSKILYLYQILVLGFSNLNFCFPFYPGRFRKRERRKNSFFLFFIFEAFRYFINPQIIITFIHLIQVKRIIQPVVDY